jgi:hypothetical protein
MAKKTTHSRSTTQRNKPKTPKSVELVRRTSTENNVESKSGLEGMVLTSATTEELEEKETKSVATTTTSKTSASARLAARRQASQKQQRSTVALITAEHYRYVRNDLIYIAILAAIMFSILIVLFFVLR